MGLPGQPVLFLVLRYLKKLDSIQFFKVRYLLESGFQ